MSSTVWKWLTWFHGPAALTLTPGAALRDELERRLGHATLWGRCIDTREFHPSRRNTGWRRWLAGGDDTAVVLHVGRLAPEKNLDVLIESWKVAHEHLGQRATFVVAGEGPLRSHVTQHLPFVRSLGFGGANSPVRRRRAAARPDRRARSLLLPFRSYRGRDCARRLRDTG